MRSKLAMKLLEENEFTLWLSATAGQNPLELSYLAPLLARITKQSAKNMKETLKSINNLLNEEDNQIFQAMELMQFNDINRQKIERVMAVIRKLSLYLNNLFEDDGNSKEIAVAKHIPGDDSDDLIGDDLDKLIAEFSNNK